MEMHIPFVIHVYVIFSAVFQRITEFGSLANRACDSGRPNSDSGDKNKKISFLFMKAFKPVSEEFQLKWK